jgi:hypothetical protein
MATPSASVEEACELVAIVDDDASVRRSMDRLVRSFGCRMQMCGSADEFLAERPLLPCIGAFDGLAGDALRVA